MHKRAFVFVFLFAFISPNLHAADSLSYSGRLTNANGSPVAGPVNLRFDLSYTDDPSDVICTKDYMNVSLTNGVFHLRLDFDAAACAAGSTLLAVLSATPSNEAVAIRVTDLSNSKTYSFQALHAMPFAIVAKEAQSLASLSATTGQALIFNGTSWVPQNLDDAGAGTLTSITAGTGLTGGTITSTGTMAVDGNYCGKSRAT